MTKILYSIIFFTLLSSCTSKWADKDFSDVIRQKNATYITDASTTYSVYGGYGSSCEHPGFHANFNAGTYNIYAAVDGVIANIESCKSAGGNAKYNITLAGGMLKGVVAFLEYSIEPMGGGSCTGLSDQIQVSLGQKVSKGDIIARMIAVGSGAHIHLNLKIDGATVCPDIFPTSIFTSQTGTKSGCASASASTMCYQLTSSEDPTKLY